MRYISSPWLCFLHLCVLSNSCRWYCLTLCILLIFWRLRPLLGHQMWELLWEWWQSCEGEITNMILCLFDIYCYGWFERPAPLLTTQELTQQNCFIVVANYDRQLCVVCLPNLDQNRTTASMGEINFCERYLWVLQKVRQMW